MHITDNYPFIPNLISHSIPQILKTTELKVIAVYVISHEKIYAKTLATIRKGVTAV